MARSFLFVAWALVLWGSFVFMATVWMAASRGVGPALSALVPRTPTGWDWLNLTSAIVAVVVWSGVGMVWVRLRGEGEGQG